MAVQRQVTMPDRRSLGPTPEIFVDKRVLIRSEGTLEEYPVAVVARALDHLDFVNNGL